MSKWEAWLQSPWELRPMRGGLGDNKEFEGVEIEARSTGSEWASLLVEGTLGRNNALKLAEEKQQVPCEFPSFATLFLSRLAAHRALHSRLTCNRCRSASSGPRSGQVRGLLFHLHVLWKLGSSACKARAGAGRRWRSSGESSRRRHKSALAADVPARSAGAPRPTSAAGAGSPAGGA